MAAAIPTQPSSDTSSVLSSSYEALALFAHAAFIAVGFRLVGLSESTERAHTDAISTSAPRLLPEWNNGFGSYTFVYAHEQSSMRFVLKVDRLGQKAEIRGVGLGDERIARLEITAKDYVSPSALPVRMPRNGDEEDRKALEEKLQQVLISEARVNDLATEIKTQIIQKLIPGLQKEGYEESSSSNNIGAQAARDAHDSREEAHARRNPRSDPLADPSLPEPARPHPFDDPLRVDNPPRRPIPDFPPPGFEDEYELQRPPRSSFGPLRGDPTGGGPFGIGHDDLYPPGLGPHDPIRPNFTPSGGGGGFGGPAGGFGGGMHPTFDDPLFRGQGGRRGGDGTGQVPDGARYDPVGPGEDPRDVGGRRGGGGFPGGGSQGSFGGLGRGGPPNPFGGYGGGDFI
jgi:hypothetical protein